MRILLIQGHPDTAEPHLCQALATAYAEGAAAAGHAVRQVEAGRFPLAPLHSVRAFLEEAPAPAAAEVQAGIAWAQHVVIVFPLWLGGMPAQLKTLLEHTLRPGFAFPAAAEERSFPRGLLGGRTARLVITMGMPAMVYRWYFGRPVVHELRRGILGLVGIRPTRVTLLGGAGMASQARREAWLREMGTLGRAAR
jgi:putative NADPH-quinone reductase